MQWASVSSTEGETSDDRHEKGHVMTINGVAIDLTSLFEPREELNNEDVRSTHGEIVIAQTESIEGFIREWRDHFVTSMRPKYLPLGWNTKHGFNGH